MKQSTILKSFLKNKTLIKSVKTGFYTGIALAVPVFFLVFHFVTRTNHQNLSKIYSSQELVLMNSFEATARYGDIVNAKEKILQQGKSIGLNDLILCDENQNEILPTYLKNDCSLVSDSKKVIIGNEAIYLIFRWRKLDPNYLEIMLFSLIMSLTFTIPTLTLGSFVTHKTVINIIRSYSEQVAKTALSSYPIPKESRPSEFIPILESIDQLKIKLLDSAEKLNSAKINEAVVLQAKQVAHDIRSPLSVLNLIIPTFDDSKNLERNQLLNAALKRVNDIAEELLKKHSSGAVNSMRPLNDKDIKYIIDNLIVEKQIQTKEKDILFQVNHGIDHESYSKINESDFSRLLSNLITNSIEAIDLNGQIIINSSTQGDRIKIEIIDNGKGIPKEILSKIGTQGFSFQKDTSLSSGSGLGVFHAKNILKSIDGDFDIFSNVGSGTKIVLTI